MHTYTQTVMKDYGGPGSPTPIKDSEAERLVSRQPSTCDLTKGGTITLNQHDIGYQVTLKPVTPVRMTPRQAKDLDAVRGRRIPARLENGRVVAGTYAIPPKAAERLFERGWLITLDENPIRVTASFAGRVALALREHATRTTVPDGWHYPSDSRHQELRGIIGPHRHGGRIYDRTSSAVCACGWSQPVEDWSSASGAASEHRSEVLWSLVK